MDSFVTIHLPQLHPFARKLFNVYRQQKADAAPPDRAALYHAMSGEAYSPEKDYLLRNHLRHLANEIRIFLSLRACEKKLRVEKAAPGPEYLEELAGRVEGAFLKKEFRSMLRKAQRSGRPGTAFALRMFMANQLKTLQEPSLGNLTQQLDLLREALQDARRNYNFQQREVESQTAFTAFNLRTMDLEAPQVSLAPLPWPDDHPYLLFLEKKSLGYLLDDPPQRIQALETALKTLQSIKEAPIKISLERTRLENNLGVAYLNQQNFVEAARYFGRVAQSGTHLPARVRRAIRINYLTARINTGDLRGALTEIEASLPELNLDPRTRIRIQCLRVFVWTALGETSLARRTTYDLLGKGSEDNYYYLRLCLAIGHYQDRDLEMAFRENTNLIQSTHYKQALQHYARVARLFNRLINLGETPAPALREKLKGESMRFFTEELSPLLSNLPINWVKELLLDFPTSQK